MAQARTRQAELQRIVADRGTVLPFVSVADLQHRGTGWYFAPHVASQGCSCFVCEGARAGRPVFIATGALLSAALLSEYARAHPAPAQQETG